MYALLKNCHPKAILLSGVLLFILFTSSLFSQTVSYIDITCGSRAPFGVIQRLTVDASGNVEFKSYNMDDGTSTTLTPSPALSAAELQQIYDLANDTDPTLNFFNLNAKYFPDPCPADGSGVAIILETTDGDENTVEVVNMGLDTVNKIVKKLNEFFTTHSYGFQLEYNNIND